MHSPQRNADRRWVDPELLPHLLVMGAVMVGTVLLLFWPQVVMHVGYSSMLPTLLGIRCPFCGMTRDFAAMLHGQRPTLNPCSAFAAASALLLYPGTVVAAWRTGRLHCFHGAAARRGALTLLGIMLVLNNWN